MAKTKSKNISLRKKWGAIIAVFVILFIVFLAIKPTHVKAPTQPNNFSYKSTEMKTYTNDIYSIDYPSNYEVNSNLGPNMTNIGYASISKSANSGSPRECKGLCGDILSDEKLKINNVDFNKYVVQKTSMTTNKPYKEIIYITKIGNEFITLTLSRQDSDVVLINDFEKMVSTFKLTNSPRNFLPNF